MSDYTHDVVAIGGGPGGYSLALECARRHLKTALVEERKMLGGTCLNIGCIPSKTLLESSEFYARIIQEAKDHGLNIEGISLNLKTMMERKAAVVKKLSDGISTLMKKRGVEVFHGRATVKSPGKISIQSENGIDEISSPRVVLATGSVPTPLTQLPFDGKRIVDSTGALAFEEVPKRLAVIGAGAVGLELGSIWCRLGTEVTIIEAMRQIVPGADSQAAKVLHRALTEQGLNIATSSIVGDAEASSKKITLRVQNQSEKSELASSEELIEVDKVLVAVGRRNVINSALSPNVAPALSSDGRFIKVDANFETSVAGLYAIGDLIGNPMLAHKAEEQALALAAIFAGEPRPPWPGPIPAVVYTMPELAWVGESEESLKTSSTPYVKGSFPFAANARSLAANVQQGFVKLFSSPNDEKLLGAVIVGPHASELIAEIVSVMAFGGSAEDIALTIHAHPTLTETVREAALSLLARPLHRT
ncbi:Dihydrolipoamide dehydrogenase of 2-oxoglutarate dehydrogenase [Olavius algarvensis spirochete endosymbiont]|uniref:dihydrolipoyl dehydrogenase n=1 Tax=Olavius algarvensis spirochete endosymbiont TaxID=260710 RepID=UPI000F24319D|nr:dihydrolipoyl dehydrogenase [Olavius algarvensis spirochete endosymbiont]CAD7837285.1 MAG: hypothetical protein [Olavius algarvensis spirochete endosymbiont]VDB00726.1 Dihydrolipoamide dehydrogenase of 2-oxoglutarate dehydrogenase [Olavius algarvensis spirochete endosymbiont]